MAKADTPGQTCFCARKGWISLTATVAVVYSVIIIHRWVFVVTTEELRRATVGVHIDYKTVCSTPGLVGYSIKLHRSTRALHGLACTSIKAQKGLNG